MATLEYLAPAIAVAMIACALPSRAQNYPVKPIRMVVGFLPGGATDIVARAIAQNLQQALGQTVLVDNRPGAASNIAAEYVAKAAADGYTYMMGSISLANNATLYSKLGYDALRDFAPVIHVTNTPFILCVHPSVPVRSVKELVALAKARPAQLQYGTGGSGSGAHLFTELLASMSGVKMQNIPYKGAAPALNDLISGQLAFVFDNVIGLVPLGKNGKVRCLAVSSKTRSKIAPDVPTMQEAGIAGYEADAWFGMLAPTGTNGAVINRINAEVDRSLQIPGVRQRLEALGCEPVGGPPAQFAAYFRAEIEKWGKVIKTAGIRLE